jgi:hypothetical protein
MGAKRNVTNRCLTNLDLGWQGNSDRGGRAGDRAMTFSARNRVILLWGTFLTLYDAVAEVAGSD